MPVWTVRATRLLLLFLMLPAVVQAQFDYVTNNGTIIITRYTGTGGAVVIPDTIDGLPVTSIGEYAFYANTSTTSVKIPNSVTSIETGAFSLCLNLTNIMISDSVTNIGNSAFSYCHDLTTVTIPSSLTSIGSYTFYSCFSLTNVTIPNGVTSIGSYAFAYASLISVTIPSSVSDIAHAAFFECSALTAITVDVHNSIYSSLDGVLFNKSQNLLIACPGGKGGIYTIPDSVTGIAQDAFQNCRRLGSVTIPNGVTRIEPGTFLGSGLDHITVPNSVTSIGDHAFDFCTRLSCVTIPNSVTSIGDYAFTWCDSLTSVTIPNSVTNIGEGAFSDCVFLTSVTIPARITRIGDHMFESCISLTGVYFQGSAPNVGSDVFLIADNATVYYLPGTTGWGPTFADRPTVLWNPLIPTSDASFGVRTNRFGFTITGSSNLVIVVEASTNLANPNWIPVGTNTLTGGSSYFSDSQWMNYPTRFYRLRSP